MRVVLDANILIAAFVARGLCQDVLELCLANHEVILSEVILTDIKDKLGKKLKMSSRPIAEAIALLRKHSIMARADSVPNNICRDPDDLHIFGLATATKAQFIVSGDNDLLIVKKYKGIRVVSPREFWDANKSRHKK